MLSHIQTLHASAPDLPVSIPPEVITYVEDGRNPDIYTREFVELVQKSNQLMKGKAEAFSSFRDILAEEISTAMPELRDSIKTVVESTGGTMPPIQKT